MKYNYPVPVSTYARSSQYTPVYHSPSYYSPSHYTPTSTYAAVSKYTPTAQSSTCYTPSLYMSTYKAASTYIPSYSKASRYTSTRRTQAQKTPAPVIPVAPAKRTVHFPNDIIFQDIVRRGDLEQIGRFMRARKVRVDALFHSGKQSLVQLFGRCESTAPIFEIIFSSRRATCVFKCKGLISGFHMCRNGCSARSCVNGKPGGGEAPGKIWR